MLCDLASQDSVRSFARSFRRKALPLHGVLNCAAVILRPFELTPEGRESHFAVNHLGHFLLVNELLPELVATSAVSGIQGRVVNVTSNDAPLHLPRATRTRGAEPRHRFHAAGRPARVRPDQRVRAVQAGEHTARVAAQRTVQAHARYTWTPVVDHHSAVTQLTRFFPPFAPYGRRREHGCAARRRVRRAPGRVRSRGTG